MKRIKKAVSILLVLLMVVGLCLPQNAVSVQAASAKVKIVYNQRTTTYKKKKTAIYVNGKKIGLSKKPIFMKSGSYMGPASSIFKSSPLKVGYKASADHKVLILTYKKHVLRMTNGDKKVIIDGKADEFGTAPIYAKYKSSGKSYWIVPIKSICTRLGISYKLSSNGRITLTGGVTTPAAKAPVASTSNAGKVVVVIDAGHGGSDSGAIGNSKVEKNLTLAIVLAAKKYFDKDSRFKVYYTRTSDTYPSLDDRCNLANKVNADVFVSVHINSGSSSSPTAKGTETLYNPVRLSATKKGNMNSLDLATNMQRFMLAATGFDNRGLVKRDGLRVLNKTNMPACLIEVGFISKKTEANIMAANTSKYGKAVYDGLVYYMKAKGRIK